MNYTLNTNFQELEYHEIHNIIQLSMEYAQKIRVLMLAVSLTCTLNLAPQFPIMNNLFHPLDGIS